MGALGENGTVADIATRLTELLSAGVKPDLDADSVETLDFILSLGDFLQFKDSMLVHKAHRAIEALELLELKNTISFTKHESELIELNLLKQKLENIEATY